MIKAICPICGRVYLANPQRLKWGRETTCSRACSYILRKQKRMAQQELICPICGKDFLAQASRIRNAKYTPVCSRDCLYKGRSLGIIRTERVAYVITEEGRQGWKRAADRRRGKPYKPPVIFTCEECQKAVTIPRGKLSPSRKFRFCSPDCANKGNRGSNNAAWRGGYEPYYGPDWKAQRRAARKRDNYTCQDCGITQKEYGKQLDVHHIIRFADFEESAKANVLENLVSLCHICHMKREWRDYPDTRKSS